MAKKTQTARPSKRKKSPVQRKKHSAVQEITWKQAGKFTGICEDFIREYRYQFSGSKNGILLTPESVSYIVRNNNGRLFGALDRWLRREKILPSVSIMQPILLHLLTCWRCKKTVPFVKAYNNADLSWTTSGSLRNLLILLDVIEGRIALPKEMQIDMLADVLRSLSNMSFVTTDATALEAIRQFLIFVAQHIRRKT